MIELTVPLGDRSYPVLVGHGARHRLLELLPVGVKRVAIVTQESIPVTVDPGVDHRVFTMGEGEHGMTWAPPKTSVVTGRNGSSTG